MASVKVAVRCRPLNKREEALGSSVIISMQGRKTFITNVKAPLEASGGDSGRERAKTFAFDFSYWSADKNDSHCINEDTVFADLGIGVIDAAIEGYNACVFAYGQTGSGKTHTMMGSQESPDVVGLTPRICQGLYNKIEMLKGEGISFRTEVSYLEIYNERVRDLLCTLGTGEEFGTHSLRVREHPKEGPYVQDLSKHLVMNYADIQDLMNIGNNRRTTAATQMNDTSSRSHAIFTITFSQARFSRDMPSEMVSKVHLVDLAGSERADASGATGVRLKEGGSINKSLVTLGTVIHALADMCSVRSPEKKQMFVPYRNSVLTWLLKDSLGGNSKTIMIATISPADVNYAETLSTLRYANRAKNIINKPTVNEDPNVRLIRDLRSEIAKLRAMLGGNVNMYPGVHERLHESEARVKVLTEEWQGRWQEMREILTEPSLGLRREGLGVVLDSELPHLIAIDDDLLSTGVILYHLKEGKTKLGMEGAATRQDIYLSGLEVEPEHCVIMHDSDGVVTLIPQSGAQCVISGTLVEEATQLSQGCVILLGQSNMFRFNHPAEAASLRRQGLRSTSLGMSRTSLLSQSMSDLVKSTENLTLQNASIELEMKHQQELEQLEAKRKLIEELERCHLDAEESRRDEQEMRDREMAEQSLIIERIHQETARLNKEAEEAQDRIKREELKLHRKSMDIEQQRKEWMEEVERFQVEKERLKQEKEKMEEEFEQRELDRQEVEEERSKLEQQQKLLFEQENEGKSPIGSVVNTAAQVALDDDERAVQARVKLLLDQVLQQDHGDDADADSLSESGSDGSRICQLEERIQSQEEQLEALVSNEQDSRSECNREERAQLRQAILQQLETGKTELLHILQSKGKRSKVKRLNSLRSKEERLESKIEELKELAHQYTNTMDELEDKRDKFERERMLELDKIETEKLQLQEMEDQERINALVEAEVKRRCFDETVRRAKALKRSRERERRTREQEMSRLKRAHEIEIQRLKQQLVSRTADAGTALPTKANPYATIHNSDSLTSLRRPSADVVAGGNDLPLRVAVPAFVLRGHGADAHYEYEVQVALRGESWVVYRRYSRFRELRQRMAAAYPVTAGIPFPPKRWFRNRSEWVVAQRREQLEGYLRRLVEVCGAAPGCPLNVADGCVVKHSLWEFSSFFKKGVFETTKHGTG